MKVQGRDGRKGGEEEAAIPSVCVGGNLLLSQALGSLAVPAPEFAALFPAGANSECLLKSLHEAQLLNLFFICKGQIRLPFLKVKLLRKSFIFTVILLSNSIFEWGIWSCGS